MPTSELSDALNPYYAQPRSRTSHASVQNQVPPAPQRAPHRSELELAVAALPRPPATPSVAHGPTNPHGGGTHAVQELLRFLASTREAQVMENKRRVAWEQEQEAKYKLRQAEMERRMVEMQQEITALKARVAFGSAPSAGTCVHHTSLSQHAQLEHVSSIASSQQPTPSTSPTLSHSSTPAMGQPVAGRALETGEASSSISYLSSPLQPPTRFVHTNPRSGLRNVRGHSESDSDGEDDSLPPRDRVRRKNHHDTRCLTIQHAMRNHMLRVMMLETDKELPDSHTEGTSLGVEEAVRFVWDKTPRQSVHNGRMKERVLKDLKEKRKLYRHVPDRDFGKKTLDSVFDQAFVTFRQKFKAQRDDSAGRAHKQREEVKAQRARRLSRRKVKLCNRSDARNKMGAFEHVAFDGALQIECMSSEESTEEEDGGRMFRIRGISWRSRRLQRFFEVLDEEDKVDSAQRPRRGVGRRERIAGPAKEGHLLPPGGVARWMISKGWLETNGEASGMVYELPPGLMDLLGEESELEVPTS